MFKNIAFVSLISLSPVFAGGTEKTQPEPKNPDLPKVLIIGDSISIGYTPYVVKMLEGEAVVKHNAGNAGPTLRGLQGIDKWLGDTKWDVIQFNWGLWDMYRWQYKKFDQSPEAYEKNLEKLVARLGKTGAKLVWATTTPACPKPEHKIHILVTPETQKKYRDVALKVMKRHGVQITDLYTFMVPMRDKYARGGLDNDVHYTKEGYRELADQVAEGIRKALKGKSGGDDARKEGQGAMRGDGVSRVSRLRGCGEAAGRRWYGRRQDAVATVG
jgi:acyl-CoA thioesterase-1